MTLVNLVLESLTDGLFSEKAISVLASPRLLLESNGGKDTM